MASEAAVDGTTLTSSGPDATRRDTGAAAVSVVMPCLNAGDVIGAQLDSLAHQTYAQDWELIVADNGSTDSTLEVVESWRPRLGRLRVVDASGRRGANHARNQGIREAAGDVILLCDADDMVEQRWVEALATAVRERRCDLVGGRVIRDLGVDAVIDDGTRGLPNWFEFLPYAETANCGFRSEVFHELGGFDERYIGGGDDVEFFWRAQLAGRELCYVPEAVVHYRERSGGWSWARQSFVYGRAAAQLYGAFRTTGMPASSLPAALRSWGSLVKHAPGALLAGGERRRGWVREVGMRWGRLVGSVRHRVVYL